MSRLDEGSKSAPERSARRSRTAGLDTESDAPPPTPAQPPGLGRQARRLLRTGVAAMRYVNSTVQAKLTELQRRLETFDGSMPTVKLDPAKVRATRLGGRHESTFQSQAFRRFKALIQQTGGNVQPILVREVPGLEYEIAFGHRRHRACLELGLPVLAVVWQGPMPDLELFAAMDAENRGRQNPSAFDQGTMYAAALEARIFDSHRSLARAIGVSHTWVLKAIKVASLPESVINAFDDPCQIQPRHARQIAVALDADSGAVLKRAAMISSSGGGSSASEVVDRLLARSPGASAATPLVSQKRLFGSWRRDAKGRAVITLEAELGTPAFMRKLEMLLGLAAGIGQVET